VPVAITGQTVLMADGLGPETSVSTWNLTTNKYSAFHAESGGDIALDAVGDVVLLGEGDTSCAAVWDLAAVNQRFSTCIPGSGSGYSNAFGLLSPAGKRYAGTQFRDDPTHRWPIIGDASTGKTDDRLREPFANSDLHIVDSTQPQVVWEDETHIIALAKSGIGDVLIRCDVDAATCEVAFDAATLSSIQNAHLTLARPVY
ncbi:MAG: hypothetical protein ABIM89_07650, partial [Mycobacteriales bacterium]